jgi:hypothetical protein
LPLFDSVEKSLAVKPIFFVLFESNKKILRGGWKKRELYQLFLTQLNEVIDGFGTISQVSRQLFCLLLSNRR